MSDKYLLLGLFSLAASRLLEIMDASNVEVVSAVMEPIQRASNITVSGNSPCQGVSEMTE